ncbi:MAG: hypothetical protein H7326_04810 [Bdellovibrionaceae bacterium]|nr:hypothetical protein [Pseudobdellovibrionaceae bacterium]
MKAILAMTLFLTALSTQAAEPTDPPVILPSIVGSWTLGGLACSSGTPLSGGIKIGQDTLKATFEENKSFSQVGTISGCGMTSKGTYKLDGSVLSTTMTESQTCKDANPIPMNDSKTFFVAHLGDLQMVSIATGNEAAMVCPDGDALVLTYNREVPPKP